MGINPIHIQTFGRLLTVASLMSLFFFAIGVFPQGWLFLHYKYHRERGRAAGGRGDPSRCVTSPSALAREELHPWRSSPCYVWRAWAFSLLCLSSLQGEHSGAFLIISPLPFLRYALPFCVGTIHINMVVMYATVIFMIKGFSPLCWVHLV